MTAEDIIRLTRQVGGSAFDHTVVFTYEEVRRFMDLVAAAQRERMISEGWRQCAQGQKTTQFCGMVEQARLEEREACARVCAEYDDDGGAGEAWAGRFAAAIRARGQTPIQEPDDGNPSF